MKNKILIIFFLVCSFVSYSQTPIKIDEFQLGGQLYDQAINAVWDTENNIYIIAESNSNISGNKSVGGFGATDYWIVKKNSNNSISWQQTIGGSNIDKPSGLILSNNHLFAYGFSYSGKTGNKTAQNKGQSDYWVIKLDTMGNILWDSTYGGAQEDLLIDAIQLKSGNILLAGTSNSDISGSKKVGSEGGNDYYLIEINNNGTILNEFVYGGNSADNLNSLHYTEDERIILSGISLSPISGDKTEAEFGGGDFWLLELEKNGNVLKDKTIGGSSMERSPILTSYLNGYVLCGGSFSEAGTGLKNSPNYGSNYDDIWILRLDKNLDIVWETTLGGGLNDFGTDIKIINNETILVSGESSSTSNNGNKSQIGFGESDLVICLLDSSGVILSDSYFGGSNNDFSPKLMKKNGPNYFSVIATSLSGANGNKTTLGFGDADVWFFDLTIPVGLQNMNLTHNNFSIFPNPVQDVLKIKFNNENIQLEKIRITNSLGKVLLERDIKTKPTLAIDVSLLPKGTYVLTLISLKGETSSKIFIK